MVRLLLDAGANIEGRPLITPVFLAAEAGDLECCRMLVQAGVDVTRKGFAKINVLHYAAKGGSVDCVKYFIEQGVDMDFPCDIE